jgi:probable HAF family extracellular repeat protein
MVDLGTLGGNWSTPTAVNRAGQVVGNSYTTSNQQHAFSWTAGGGMVDLGTLGGSYVMLSAVSEGGQVIGSSTPPGDVAYHAFSWSRAGGMHDLTFDGSASSPKAVSNAGHVIGDGQTTTGGSYGFVWTEDDGIVAVTLGGPYSSANAVSDMGQVVGSSTTSSASPSRAFSWTRAGGVVDLGTLSGDTSGASLVTEGGLVAGSSTIYKDDRSIHAVLWRPGPGPSTTDMCKLGKWHRYGTSFKNEGDCVSYAVHRG